MNHRIGDWGTQRRHRVKFEIDFGLYLVDLVLSIVTQCVSGGIGCLIHQVLRGYWVLSFRLWILGIGCALGRWEFAVDLGEDQTHLVW